MTGRRKRPLENQILKYLRSVGYRGMGVMSKNLDVEIGNVKWTLNKLVTEGKVEPVVHGGVRLYKVKGQKSRDKEID